MFLMDMINKFGQRDKASKVGLTLDPLSFKLHVCHTLIYLFMSDQEVQVDEVKTKVKIKT